MMVSAGVMVLPARFEASAMRAMEAVGVGLLGVEAVASVVLEEEAVEAEVGADVARGVDGFVGQDRHERFGMGGADGFEGIDDAVVDVGVVEFVDAVVARGRSVRASATYSSSWMSPSGSPKARRTSRDAPSPM